MSISACVRVSHYPILSSVFSVLNPRFVYSVGSSSLASSSGGAFPAPAPSSRSRSRFTTFGRPSTQTDTAPFQTLYHPKSGRPSRLYSYEEYNRPPPRSDVELDDCPWAPFRSRGDCELASIAVDAEMSDSLVTRLLRLIKDIKTGDAQVTFDSVRQVRESCDEATHEYTPFTLYPVDVDYKGEKLHHEFYARDFMDWALDLLENESLAPHFVWDAQRQYKHNGNDYVRYIDEPWTADRWWDIQDGNPSVPFAFILYADKTRLSSAGNVQGYPVVARCANLPVDIRNGRGAGGGCLVGWLPIVEDNAEDEGLLSYTTLKRVVWHDSVRQLFKNASFVSENGLLYEKLYDGVARWLFILILILSADYEEQTMMTLIRGSSSKHPCPVCLIPSNLQHDLSQHYPRRSAQEAMSLVRRYNNADITSQEKREVDSLLDEQSLRPVNNAFWDLCFSDPADTISVDHLHSFHLGVYGKHQQPEMLKILGSTKNSRKDIKKLNHQIDRHPRWRGLGHFEKISNVTFGDGNKFRDISKQVLFAAYNILTPSYSPEGYKLLRLIQSYLELDCYFSLDVHTEETIRAAREEVTRFGDLLKIALEQGRTPKIKINWNFPKLHALFHFLNDILQKGVSRNSTTRVNEVMHGPLKQSYENRSNGKDFVKQILRVDSHRLALAVLGQRIDRQDELKRRLQSRVSVEDSDDTPTHEADLSWQYHLGSPQKPQTIQQLVVSKGGEDIAFADFHHLFEDYINLSLFPDLEIELAEPLTIPDDFMMNEYCFLKLNYESYETWRTHTDYLRCSPMFYNEPRYDCVLAKISPETVAAVRLIMLFDFVLTFDANGSPQPEVFSAALVQPYTDTPDLNDAANVSKVDNDLNFIRVKACPRDQAIIIPIDSFVRGVLLSPDFDRAEEYLINTYVDGDIFLRMKGPWTSAFL
ncbi:hypothetical protein CONPUDRAFT_66265 [Coniophora puteana RWD-64-598 SS2]|uniref:Uncharacterized protein n=1 Tax=Coniophora puteana (strain RWD-64-598) TaxID=741705 RepID=A0A5M3M8U4_CONPW|nr:uncharacterized protein CONPUDRAFT_66265 [Coniophora puteana RWD-64-598 SS2]EIW75195.1 hypothetical protein CONPUDRAFT_66265 [Coniophora puteana RWD-64-598 SS2]